MPDIKRAGGHMFIEDRGWVLPEDVEDDAPALSMSNTKAELLEAAAAAGLDVDESNTKAEILEALDVA